MPAWDMAWGFRANASFVTDPAYQVPGLGETYPHTYTNSNGESVNAGWSVAMGTQDLAASNDPRIAGDNYVGNNDQRTFSIDLSSGSAPGASDYLVDLAFGDATVGRIVWFQIKDNTTVVIDGSNGGSGFTTAAGHFIDATLADVAATTTWTGATTTKTWASTTVNVVAGAGAAVSEYTLIAHFRLTQQAAGTAAKQLVSSLMLLGVGT